MARDHARIRLDIWSDDDWRTLTSGAQWLYMHLLSSPRLSFAGATDWRPSHIAAQTAELSAFDVEYFAGELEEGLFLVVDRRSEEVLIRSFVKHDGLMSSPNLAKALLKAHADMGSSALRAVVVHELRRLKRAQPTLKGWPYVENLLVKRAISPSRAQANLPANPSRNPSGNPSEQGSPNPSATPVLPNSLTPSSSSSSSPSVTREGANG